VLFALSLTSPLACGGNSERRSETGRRVQFHASDGVQLSGRLFDGGTLTVVASHMGGQATRATGLCLRADWPSKGSLS
jgi:hypothetical protein